jgi:GGDEF domain-containing protein
MEKTTMTKIALTAALGLVITLTLSCSGDGGDGGGNIGNPMEPIKKAKITGVSQKGPFVEGTKATLYELDDSFTQTSRSFFDIIANERGEFEIENIELASPYVLLEANGKYRNEVTGKVTSSSISLFAIADVREKDNINVNILTHLEYYRVLNLVKNERKTVADAKKQAQREIFAVFGIDSDSFKDSEDMSIFGTSESDAALLAISILLQGELNEGEFLQRLTKFSKSIEATGTWNDEEVKAAMAEWAVTAGLNGKLKKTRSNILDWRLSLFVPDFEKFVNDYWAANYCSGNNCFTDPRDGATYRLATINNATIMVDWLRYGGEDGNLGKTESCHECSSDFFLNYPGLYKVTVYIWAEAQTICPAGWRLPDDMDVELVFACQKNKLFSKPYYSSYWFNGKRLIFNAYNPGDNSDIILYNPNGIIPDDHQVGHVYCVKN